MKRKLKKLMIFTFLFITPILTIPRLPKIPTITKVELPAGVSESARKAGAEAIKGLDIDWSKFIK